MESPKIFSVKRLVFAILIVLLCIGVLVSVLVVSFHNNNVRIGDNWYSSELEEIDFSHSDLNNTAGLEQFTNAKYIDLRHNPLSPTDIVTLIEALPNCEILWSVPIGNALLDSNITEIYLSDISASDITPLYYLSELKYIDARGYDYEIVEQLFNDFPNCRIGWDIAVGDKRYPPSTQTLDIGEVSEEDIMSLLLFESLTKVDASGCTAYDALMSVSQQLPECDFTWTVDIGNFTVSNKDTQLNFNRTAVSDVAALDKDLENLKYLPNLTYIDMCGCGVSNEQMAAWRDKYPHCKFVWEVTFGTKRKNWTVRTDIQVFSTLLYESTKIGNQNDYMNLFLYCTDLVALDLGHNYISDISALTNLKKLQAIILTDNPFSDISPLAELPDLVFVELIGTHVADLTPLQKCTKVKHLDISGCKVKDLTPLYDCPWLESLFVYYSHGGEKLTAFRKARPDVELYYLNRDMDKREDEIRTALKKAFTNYKSVVEFISWDNIIYK